MAVATETRVKETAAKIARPLVQDAVTEVYLITGAGLYELTGGEAFTLAQKIERDETHSLLDYRHYDEDKRTWAYWAVQDKGGITPLTFPELTQYTTRASQLYTKAVVFAQILARVLRKLKEKPQTMWDKMMKPTTIIVAIVAVVLAVGLFMVAASG